MIDTFHMARQIEKALLDTVTNIIAVMHWGEEYFTAPNATQKKLSSWLHERGADIVIGSHPHVIQPISYIQHEQDTLGVTVFSLGNFVSNQSKRYTNGGLGVHLTLYRQNGKPVTGCKPSVTMSIVRRRWEKTLLCHPRTGSPPNPRQPGLFALYPIFSGYRFDYRSYSTEIQLE